MLACGVLLLAAGVPDAARAQVRITQAEALRLAFPVPAEIERRTAFLTQQDLEEARRLAGPEVTVDQRVVTYYVGRDSSGPRGVAYFDVHRVRTRNEVLMFVVTPNSHIERIELLAFAEPPEYAAPDAWLRQLEERSLTDELSLTGGVVTMSGATLTSQAAVAAARRVLALHAVIRPFRRAVERRS